MKGFDVKRLPEPYRMYRGGEALDIELAYETWGTLSPDKDNAILLTTGLSPGSHARSSEKDPTPGWWERMIGPGKALDTNRFFVICNNSFGSCHGSTGPASPNPLTGEPFRMSFPMLSVEDIARTSHELVRTFGISRLRAVVGSSLGGMTALAYAALFPDEVDLLVSISAAAHASPLAIALRSLQREAIRSDPDWQGGNYPMGKGPYKGMALARKLGVLSYRSADEWAHRFQRKRMPHPDPGFGIEFEVEAYLQHHADHFVKAFDANCYLYLSKAMDRFDLADHGTSLDDAFRRIAARRILIVGVETDLLFPVGQQEALARGLRKAGRDVRFVRLPSLQGHDSFLIDIARFSPAVGSFLKEGD